MFYLWILQFIKFANVTLIVKIFSQSLYYICFSITSLYFFLFNSQRLWCREASLYFNHTTPLLLLAVSLIPDIL